MNACNLQMMAWHKHRKLARRFDGMDGPKFIGRFHNQAAVIRTANLAMAFDLRENGWVLHEDGYVMIPVL